MEITWETTGDGTPSAAAIREAGGSVEHEMGFEPITTLTVVAAVIAVARAIKTVVQDVRHCGAIIDQTATPISIREMPGWDRGVVMVITPDGHEIHKLDPSDGDPIGLIAALTGKD